MHESIDNRIVELKEIALQIMNLIGQKNYGPFPQAFVYLQSIANGNVEKRVKQYGASLAYGMKDQLDYVLSNLDMWRGNDARNYKLLLKEYLKYFQGKVNTGKLSESINPMWQAIRGIGD